MLGRRLPGDGFRGPLRSRRADSDDTGCIGARYTMSVRGDSAAGLRARGDVDAGAAG